MPTVAELRAKIKKHQEKNCTATSKMKKADLLKVVARIDKIRAQREAGVAAKKKNKIVKPKTVKPSAIKPLTAPSKKFSSDLSMPKAKKKQTRIEDGKIIYSPADKKRIDKAAEKFGGAGAKMNLVGFLDYALGKMGPSADGTNPGGAKTFVKYWLSNLPDSVKEMLSK